jgi:NAD+ synthase (glutamine-hydrolysing)
LPSLSLAQINPTVGDLSANCDKIVAFARDAAARGADLVVFPELCVCGYPPLDLLESPRFIDAVEAALADLALRLPPDVGVIVGAPIRNPNPIGKRLFNAALLFEGGRVAAEVRKRLLPTYDVFDEYRYFEPGATSTALSFRGLRIGLHVCEDMWNNEEQADHHLYEANPIDLLAAEHIDVFVNISASPFAVGKHERRNKIVSEICREHGIPFVLVNTVGANTEIIFDGDSRVHAADGSLIVCAPSFEEHLLFWDSGDTATRCSMPHRDVVDLHDALVLGIRDYFEKTGAFDKALVGLSGGIDSAVTCALAVTALGADRVTGITMPSRYSSPGSVDDSAALAANLGIEFHNIPVGPAVDSFASMLSDVFANTEPGVAEENIQSRTRGLTLMAVSNKFRYLLLTTGNKSEMSVGYATLYGDMNGGLAVLSDVYKTDIYTLAGYINERDGANVIPRSTIDKPPSAELRPGQLDSDSLPDYDTLDRILRLYIEGHREYDDIVRMTGFDAELVIRILDLVDQNEYKRRQAAPGLRVSTKAFGMGRRVPIVMNWQRADAIQRLETRT